MASIIISEAKFPVDAGGSQNHTNQKGTVWDRNDSNFGMNLLGVFNCSALNRNVSRHFISSSSYSKRNALNWGFGVSLQSTPFR